jgi:hypothetical protein
MTMAPSACFARYESRRAGESLLSASENLALSKVDKVEAWWDAPAEDCRSGAGASDR